MGKDLLKKGNNVCLRDARLSDSEIYLKWMQEGEWREFDAPWERKDLDEGKIKNRFKQLYLGEKTEPRKRAIICLPERKPIGWVNRYFEEEKDEKFFLGIDICEDDHLNRGVGTEALSLWIDYLFDNSEVRRLRLNTYSFNDRMKRVAEKLDFMKENTDKKAVCWQGKWIDRERYVLPRREWNKR